jgi:hypothetical protein
MAQKKSNQPNPQDSMPSAEEVQRELAKAESMDDFFGKDGIFARLFADTLEQMLEAELTDKLGYEPYEAKGRNSGNSRNGHYDKKVRTSGGDVNIQVPRDRKGEFEPRIVKKFASNTNELEEKIVGMYARGMSTRDIQETLEDLYGVDVSAGTISAITDKIWPLVRIRSLAEPAPGGNLPHRLPGRSAHQAAARGQDRERGRVRRAGGGPGRPPRRAGPLDRRRG